MGKVALVLREAVSSRGYEPRRVHHEDPRPRLRAHSALARHMGGTVEISPLPQPLFVLQSPLLRSAREGGGGVRVGREAASRRGYQPRRVHHEDARPRLPIAAEALE